MGAAQEQFDVGGMACSFCAESIRTAYDRTDGVGDVDVSLAHEEVLVQYDDEQISAVELKDALRDLGYTIRDPSRRSDSRSKRPNLPMGSGGYCSPVVPLS